MSAAVIGALAGSLLSGIASQNAQDDMQKYNERMYDQYLSPSAQAKNLLFHSFISFYFFPEEFF